ncbi:MAG TPA: hypothetical protein P5277_02595 [Candidatus Paceibacterota bacterium]|nr:hypothetical protein [Candidatus Paceibacterota bacterium]
MKRENCNIFQQEKQNNRNITCKIKPKSTYSWQLCPVKPNPECVKVFFESLKLRGKTLNKFAKEKLVNRSKLSQVLHGLDIPRTPGKRKFWAEEILDFDVQLFWIPDITSKNKDSNTNLNKKEVKQNE